MMVEVVSLVEQIISFIAVYYILTAALNIKAGMTGIPDFGHAMFFAIGGIVVGNLAAQLAAVAYGVPASQIITNNTAVMAEINKAYLPNAPLTAILLIIFSIIVSLILGGLLGLLASYPALRLRGDYLAIMLLAASEGLRIFAMYTRHLMGSTPTVGLTKPALFAWTEHSNLVGTLFTVILAILVYIFVERFYHSPSGRLFRAVRDDEDSAKAVGKDIAATRRDAMVIGSALAALAGVAYSLNPWMGGASVAAQSIFDRVLWTFWPWALMILGGMASNRGVALVTLVVGAAVIGPIRIYKNQLAQLLPLESIGIDPGNFANALEYILIGVLILVVLFTRPRGVIPEGPSNTLPREELEKLAKSVKEA